MPAQTEAEARRIKTQKRSEKGTVMAETHGNADVEQWGLFELALQGSAAGNPYLNVELSAQFTHEHRTIDVDGFYDGEGVYRVRFMPDTPGTWNYRTQSNSAALSGVTGTFDCVAPRANNHGPVRVVDPYHFAYVDGTPFHPVGTTCYVWNLQGDTLEEQTLRTLRRAPFNKVRFCVFPKHYLFNRNEPPTYPFPGEVKRDKEPPPFALTHTEPPPDYWDFTRFNPPYFRHLERRIGDLQKLGIEADLILFHPYDAGAWGFDRMPAEVNVRYLRYIVARLAAFRNVWWSFANEYDLMIERTMEEWDRYFMLVQEADPYGHLRSIHNCRSFYDHGKPWVTHCSVQHHDLAQMTEWQRQYRKPVVVDECGYEGNINQLWGDLPAEELVARFWLGFADGGYVGHGETYWNEEEVLWWSKGGELRGESVARIAFLRQIIEAVPGPGLVPLRPTPFTSFVSISDAIEAMASPSSGDDAASIIAEGAFNIVAGGHSGTGYYLLYFGVHQPLFREFNLPDGGFRIDVIDTWNMTITRVADDAGGHVRVELPAKPYQAIRIERIERQAGM